jgi:outer membrane protein TolC
LQVCRFGPAVATGKATRAVGEAESGAVEPMRNPSVVVEHQQTLDGPSERETVVGVAVPLAIGGRRSLLRDAAGARRTASLARAEADGFETALRFRHSYATALLEKARVFALRRQQEALESLTKTLAELAARGERASYDVRRQQAELKLHARTLAQSEIALKASLSELSLWLGRPLEVDSLADVDSSFASVSVASGVEHPDVAALRADGRAAGLESDAARRRWVPELEVFGGYRQVADAAATGHGLSLSLSVPLTFFEHGSGAAAKANAEQALLIARADRLRRENAIERNAASMRAAALESVFQEAERTAAMTSDLTAGALRLYSAGEASIAEVLDAYRTAEDAQLDRLLVLEDLVTARLDAMRASGTQFDPELDVACRNQGASR